VLGGQGYGTVYRINLTSLAYSRVVWFGNSNGRSPSGSLFAKDGVVYGVTRLGGAYNAGTVYQISVDATAPTITGISASPNVLLPANGSMVPVTVSVAATDNLDHAPKSKIVGVTSNQTITGDWVITGDLTLSLRAKRSGRIARIYTVQLQCVDASGNTSSGSVTVTVPK
jgi:uncharacterized repeat protein (TIGR03803 family)